MKKKLISLISGITLVLPVLVLAQDARYFEGLVRETSKVLDRLVVFLVALAVVWFIWNVIRYTMSEDEEKKGAAKKHMVWGIVAIAVIVSVWGLVAILRGAFGVENNNQIPPGVYNMIPKTK